MKLQIIRDLQYINDRNAKSFVSAIKKKAKAEDITVMDVLVADESALEDVNLLTPTIIIEPFRFELNPYNNVDKHSTAKVIADICKGYIHQNILVINRSELIGKPLFHMLIEMDHTVMMAHSKTTSLKNLIAAADIVIFATGADMSKYDCTGKIVIDASNDYKGHRGLYFGMSYIGKATVQKIIDSVKGGYTFV